MNEAGFPVTARIRLRVPNGCGLEELTGMRQVPPLRADAQGCYWDLQLDAYDAIGACLPSHQVDVAEASANWSPEIERALEAKVSDLENRRVSLSRLRVLEGMENPGFEAGVLDAGQIPGWSIRRGSEANVEVDATQSRSGKASLRLAGAEQPPSVMSSPFKAPKTGRLTVRLWARSSSPASGLRLQVGVLGEHDGKTFYRLGQVQEIGNDWGPRPAEIYIPDVPEQGLETLRLHLQLVGQGEVWIDDVQLDALDFSAQQEQIALIKTVHSARATLLGRQVPQCIRILEGYWPRFLLEHVPPFESPQPAVAQTPQQPVPPPQPKDEDKKESGKFLGRIRDLVPERLRF